MIRLENIKKVFRTEEVETCALREVSKLKENDHLIRLYDDKIVNRQEL